MSDLKFQFYGSPSSEDLDIMVFVDSLGSIDDNKKAIDKLKTRFSGLFPDYKCDVHLAVVKEGMIVDVSHGTYDECNNSLYYTYKYRRQPFDNAITKPYERTNNHYYHLKLIRISRFILSFFSREPELRSTIKQALRGSFIDRLEALKLIDFTKYFEFPNKKEEIQNIYKVCAYQIVCALALKEGIEIYTKEHTILFYPESKVFIKREKIRMPELELLNKMLKEYIDLSTSELPFIKNLYEI